MRNINCDYHTVLVIVFTAARSIPSIIATTAFLSIVFERTVAMNTLKTVGAIVGLLIAMAPLAASRADTSSSNGASSRPSVPENETQSPTTLLKPVLVAGSVTQTTERVGFNQAQLGSLKDIRAGSAVIAADYLRNIAVNSANSWGDNES